MGSGHKYPESAGGRRAKEDSSGFILHTQATKSCGTTHTVITHRHTVGAHDEAHNRGTFHSVVFRYSLVLQSRLRGVFTLERGYRQVRHESEEAAPGIETHMTLILLISFFDSL